MSAILIGYARCFTDKQDLEANRQILLDLGVSAERIYLDRAYSGTNRAHPGLDQALDAVRPGDTLAVPKLDRLARSVPDARQMRTREGMAIARAKGNVKGRAPKLSKTRQEHLCKVHAAGEHTIVDLAELFEVSRPPIYRVLERAAASTAT